MYRIKEGCAGRKRCCMKRKRTRTFVSRSVLSLLFFARLLVFLDKTRDKGVKEEGERERKTQGRFSDDRMKEKEGQGVSQAEEISHYLHRIEKRSFDFSSLFKGIWNQ